MNSITQLGYALLGLLHQQPMSGYDLRKIFTSTAMGSFSDSPGAIYPALARLEKQHLIEGSVAGSAALRRRRTFRLTAAGLQALQDWLRAPVSPDDMVRGVDTLMLRFAFMDQVFGAEQSLSFLHEFSQALAAYIPGLEAFLSSQSRKMPRSAKLALECGIQEYCMRLRWAQDSIRVYEMEVRKDV